LHSVRISEHPDVLGESPVWDSVYQRLYWVDGVQAFLRSYTPETGELRDLKMPSQIGSVGLAEGNRLVVGLADGVYLVEMDTGSIEPIFRLDPPNPRVRFNDGRVDRQGRFVTGTMARLEDEPLGELYRITGRRGDVEVLANGIRITNTLCFGANGDEMYFSDSLDRMIRKYRYGTEVRDLGSPLLCIDTALYDSSPDGAAIDTEGYLWVAMVQRGAIARFRPNGALDTLIDTPADMPSSVGFGGKDMSTLFVTSIRSTESGRAISRHPDAGHLFAIENLGVEGLAEPRFRL
jgi:sugar lactone lactonase YvrE